MKFGSSIVVGDNASIESSSICAAIFAERQIDRLRNQNRRAC